MQCTAILRPRRSAGGKILRSANATRAPPDATELDIAQALVDLEASVPDLKAELRTLQFSSAKEVDVKGGRKALVMWVWTEQPVPNAIQALRVSSTAALPG